MVLKQGPKTLAKGVVIGEPAELTFMERIINTSGLYRLHFIEATETDPTSDIFRRIAG